MPVEPFSSLRAFSDNLDVRLFSKRDQLLTDSDIAAKVASTAIASLYQAHGKESVIVREPTSRVIKADGLMTDQKNLWLTIRAADCQNFVVYDPVHGVIGALHVGWRCLVAGTIPTFLKMMKDEWGTSVSDLMIVAGPSLCKSCSEFTDPDVELPGIPQKLIDGRHADLQGWAEHQFKEAGVDLQKFERHPDCTKCSSEKWWSYRGGDREKVLEGWTNVMAICLC